MTAIRNLTTEACNPASMNIDDMAAIEIVQSMNEQDGQVAAAVGSRPC